jgi:hypothetical protein
MELNLLFEGNNDGGCKINELQQTINKLTKNKDFINYFIIFIFKYFSNYYIKMIFNFNFKRNNGLYLYS